ALRGYVHPARDPEQSPPQCKAAGSRCRSWAPPLLPAVVAAATPKARPLPQSWPEVFGGSIVRSYGVSLAILELMVPLPYRKRRTSVSPFLFAPPRDEPSSNSNNTGARVHQSARRTGMPRGCATHTITGYRRMCDHKIPSLDGIF